MPRHFPAGLDEVETRVNMLLRAACHVRSEYCQHCLYEHLLETSKLHAKNNVCRLDRCYITIEMPLFETNQRDNTHYFTPLSVYPKNSELISYKGANHAAALIWKTLPKIGIMREEEKVAE